MIPDSEIEKSPGKPNRHITMMNFPKPRLSTCNFNFEKQNILSNDEDLKFLKELGIDHKSHKDTNFKDFKDDLERSES